MILYIFISYMITLGLIIEAFEDERPPLWVWFVYLFSPIVLPIFIGIMLSEQSKKP